MLIRSDIEGIFGGAAQRVRSTAMSLASVPTLLGGLLLLIGP